jgi:hypothetical protein
MECLLYFVLKNTGFLANRFKMTGYFIYFTRMKAALSSILFLLCLNSFSQPPTELSDSSITFINPPGKPVRTKVLLKADSSFLPTGHYKINSENVIRIFQVADSGWLTGRYIDSLNRKTCMNRIYERGVQIREYLLSVGKVIAENFDSTVSVMQYNSKKKNWEPVLKTVLVEKEYTPSGKIASIRYAKGPYDSYASYLYQYDKLIRENIPHYKESKWDTRGQLYEQTIYNWTKKQIEISHYKEGILHQKMILVSPANKWDPSGVINYSTDPNAPIVVTTYTYAEGNRIVKKEVDEPRKKTVTEYDTKGKISSVNTYPKARFKVGLDVVAPVEMKQ